jgi:hemerythrin superfamily protein
LKYWSHEPMQQARNKNVQQNLPTYKKVLTDHRSRSLEL